MEIRLEVKIEIKIDIKTEIKIEIKIQRISANTGTEDIVCLMMVTASIYMITLLTVSIKTGVTGKARAEFSMNKTCDQPK